MRFTIVMLSSIHSLREICNGVHEDWVEFLDPCKQQLLPSLVGLLDVLLESFTSTTVLGNMTQTSTEPTEILPMGEVYKSNLVVVLFLACNLQERPVELKGSQNMGITFLPDWNKLLQTLGKQLFRLLLGLGLQLGSVAIASLFGTSNLGSLVASVVTSLFLLFLFMVPLESSVSLQKSPNTLGVVVL